MFVYFQEERYIESRIHFDSLESKVLVAGRSYVESYAIRCAALNLSIRQKLKSDEIDIMCNAIGNMFDVGKINSSNYISKLGTVVPVSLSNLSSCLKIDATELKEKMDANDIDASPEVVVQMLRSISRNDGLDYD